MNNIIVVGMPYFTHKREVGFRAPFGEIDTFKKIFFKEHGPRDIVEGLAVEYFSIIDKLFEMGYQIKLLCSLPDMRQMIDRDLHFDCINIDNKFPQPLYPRDAWTQIDGTNTFLVASCMPGGKLPFAPTKDYIVNRFGEGGKVFSVGDYFITTTLTDGDNPNKFTGIVSSKDFLPSLEGKKIILLPNPVVYEKIENIEGYTPETHADRFMFVIKDKNGEVHVILHPGIYTGWMHPFSKPNIGPEKSIQTMKSILKNSGIIHVHVPKKVFRPYGLGAVQFSDGKVLLSGNENCVQEILESILGKQNVFATRVSVNCYGAIFRAGIRCLVNEISL